MNILPLLVGTKKNSTYSFDTVRWSADKYILQEEYPWKHDQLPNKRNQWVEDVAWSGAADKTAQLKPVLEYPYNGVLVGTDEGKFLSMEATLTNGTDYIQTAPLPHLIHNSTEYPGGYTIEMRGASYFYKFINDIELGTSVEYDLLNVIIKRTGLPVCEVSCELFKNGTQIVSLHVLKDAKARLYESISTEIHPATLEPGKHYVYTLGFFFDYFTLSIKTLDGVDVVPSVAHASIDFPAAEETVVRCFEQRLIPHHQFTSYLNKLTISKN